MDETHTCIQITAPQRVCLAVSLLVMYLTKQGFVLSFSLILTYIYERKGEREREDVMMIFGSLSSCIFLSFVIYLVTSSEP